MGHLAIWILACVLSAKAQYAAGIGVAGEFALHSASFRTLSPSIPNCCPGFRSEAGWGWGIVATYDGLRLAPRLRLLAEGGYSHRQTSFRQVEQTTVSTTDGTGVPGVIEHELYTRLEAITLAALLGYNPFEQLHQLQFRVGVQLSRVLRSSFSQRERLVEPPYGYFTDTGRRVRNEFSGTIPNLAPGLVSIGLGARYLLPLVPHQHLALQPALMGWLGLSRLVSGVAWRAHSITLSVSFVFAPLDLPSPLQPGTPQ
ncbi:MAG: hypothetical protein NZ960_00465 [Candidatus Kapabacteria bacterium]|nr:hypothetical protein [Candidatus Kapabacteria bacterium]MDW8011500.1 hypothetical protein [Bacteroidota bacterium]